MARDPSPAVDRRDSSAEFALGSTSTADSSTVPVAGSRTHPDGKWNKAKFLENSKATNLAKPTHLGGLASNVAAEVANGVTVIIGRTLGDPLKRTPTSLAELGFMQAVKSVSDKSHVAKETFADTDHALSEGTLVSEVRVPESAREFNVAPSDLSRTGLGLEAG